MALGPPGNPTYYCAQSILCVEDRSKMSFPLRPIGINVPTRSQQHAGLQESFPAADMVTDTEARQSLCTNAVVGCGSGTQKQNLPNELWLSVPVTAPGPGVLVCNSDTANRRSDPHMPGGCDSRPPSSRAEARHETRSPHTYTRASRGA